MESNVVAPEIAHYADEVFTRVDKVEHAHFRLIWLAGSTPLRRSNVLETVAERLSCPLVSVGRRMAADLLDLSPRLRPISAEEVFQDLLLGAGSDTICLDHLDMLFDPPLRLNAVDLVQNASRRFLLIASWPGTTQGDTVAYGPGDHPAHVEMTFEQVAAPIITLS